MNGDRPYWVAWSQIKRIGSVLMGRLNQQFGSLEAAWTASEAGLLTVEGIGPPNWPPISSDSDRTSTQTNSTPSISKPTPNSGPSATQNIPDSCEKIHAPPPLLYYRGIPDVAEMEGNAPTIAIVGTRRPSPYGLKWTRRLTHRLSQEGFTIVSGLAAGIDTEAHRTCLSLSGRTVAVVGTGVDVVYPRRNQSLYDEIIETGLVVSEYPAGTPPDRLQFPQRNRIIAGLSRATLVTEAPQKSGALITAYLANEFLPRCLCPSRFPRQPQLPRLSRSHHPRGPTGHGRRQSDSDPPRNAQPHQPQASPQTRTHTTKNRICQPLPRANSPPHPWTFRPI